MPALARPPRAWGAGTGKPFECAICGRRLVDKRSLRQHVAAVHPAPADEMRAASLAVERHAHAPA